MKRIINHLKNPITTGELKDYSSEYGWLEVKTLYLFGIKVFTEVLTFSYEDYDHH
jgi:hypothetical protein